MRGYRELEEPTTANYGPSQVSGVHEAPTQPAPYVEEELFRDSLVGSVPVESLSAHFQPVVALCTGKTFAFEALPRCDVEGLRDPEELFARAAFEKKIGELGRAVRRAAFDACPGAPIFIGVHPHELKDSWLIRPDDAISSHDREVYLQVDQPVCSAVCMHVLSEVASRTGVSLVVDDLGASGSNLSQVIELGPSFVKLDAALVRGIDRNLRKRKVVSALVKMCADLGAQLIAKAVDSEAALRTLIELGVPYGQGSVLGAPAPKPVASKWLPGAAR
ncbi:MAG TPA: EAL domain-containing protein [Polyangiales bacterium]